MSRRSELILTLAAFLLIIVVRSSNLGADPPIGLTFSTGIYTDTPAYTLFAKHYVQTGEFNPLDDQRMVFFLKSGVTLAATAVFSLFGVGVLSSHFVGLLFSLLSLFLFYLVVRKITAPAIALIFLLLAGLNFNLVAYGRFPFLEHAMMVGAFASFVSLLYWRSNAGFAVGGALLAASILFGKVIGIVFLFPFACYLIYRLAVTRPDEPKLPVTHLIAFLFGFIAVSLAWYILAYTPYSAEVSDYLQEHSVSLYGAPEGLESLDKFVYKMVSFGGSSNLLERMVAPALLAAGFLFAVLLTVSRPRFWRREQSGWLHGGHLFLAAMIIGFFGSLMIWNYQPLRYQIVIIYPVCAAAAIVIVALWEKVREGIPEEIPWWYFPIIYPLALVVVYHLSGVVLRWAGQTVYFDDIKFAVAALTAALVALSPILIDAFRKTAPRKVSHLARAVAVIALTVAIGHGFYDFITWVNRATYTSRDTSVELGSLLSPGAVLSGPFGPLLALENDHQALIHMFGVSHADPNLFRRFPVTHLVLDQSNEDRAREDYPDMFQDALHVATLRVGKVQLRMFNIAHTTKNKLADRYEESLFERGAQALQVGNKLAGADLVHQYNQQHPDNFSGHLIVASIAQAAGQWEMAEDRFKKAVEFSPTNYVLYERLAGFYRDRYAAFGDTADKEKGLENYRLAMFYAPAAHHIAPKYHRLQVSDPWQLRDTTSSSQP